MSINIKEELIMASKTTASNITQLSCATSVINAITFTSNAYATTYPFYVLKNMSAGNMYISFSNDFEITSDGVYIVGANESIVIRGQRKTIYIRSAVAGIVNVIASEENTNPFKVSSGGGGGGYSLTIDEIREDLDAYVTVADVTNTYAINVDNKTSMNVAMEIGNATAKTISVSNVPTRTELLIELTYTAGASITWFSSISWDTGNTPIFEVGKVYYIVMITSDSGTSWKGFSRGGV
jgi:hypothetical protein